MVTGASLVKIFTSSPIISNTCGFAPKTPKDMPTSTLQIFPSHSQFAPCICGVCPTTKRFTGMPSISLIFSKVLDNNVHAFVRSVFVA